MHTKSSVFIWAEDKLTLNRVMKGHTGKSSIFCHIYWISYCHINIGKSLVLHISIYKLFFLIAKITMTVSIFIVRRNHVQTMLVNTVALIPKQKRKAMKRKQAALLNWTWPSLTQHSSQIFRGLVKSGWRLRIQKRILLHQWFLSSLSRVLRRFYHISNTNVSFNFRTS